MKKIFYALINKNRHDTNIFESYDFDLVIHEYLSMIDDYLCVITKLCLPQNIIEKVNFDHIYVVAYVDVYKKYEMIKNIYKFDIINKRLCDMHGPIQIPIKFYYKNLLESINKNLNHNNIKQNHHKEPEPHEGIVNELKSTMNLIDTTAKMLNTIPMEELSIKPQKNEDNIIVDETFNIDTNTLDLLKEEIDKMKSLKDKEKEKFDKLKVVVTDNEKNYGEQVYNLNNKKRELKNKKESVEQKIKKFNADKQAYLLIKNDIKNKKIGEENISVLFKEKYPLFKFLDEKNILNDPNAFDTYTLLQEELYPQKKIMELPYVPHNIEYLGEDEKKNMKK